MLYNLKFAFRRLAKSPGYTVVAIITLAFGIGANTAIFSMVNGALFKPLPFSEPERIVFIREKPPQGRGGPVTSQTYLDWVRQNRSFECMAAAGFGGPIALISPDGTESLPGIRFTAHYFDVLGAKVEYGRGFAPDEDQPGKDRVAIITHRLWKQRFAGDPKIIGRQLNLDGKIRTVIGIMPGGGYWDRVHASIYIPLAFTPQMINRQNHQYSITARLKPDVTLAQARADMEGVETQIGREYPETNKGWGIVLDHLETLLTPKPLRQVLYLLLGAVGLILLMACANLANLTLAQNTAREREIAIRASIGAGRRALVEQLLTESLLLSFAGGLAGIGLGTLMTASLQWVMPPQSIDTRFLPPSSDISIDGHVLLFALFVSIVTAILVGLVPALQATRQDLATAVKQSGPAASSGRNAHKLRSSLVILQVALAFILLSASGLLIRSISSMLTADLGYNTRGVLTAGVSAQGPLTQNAGQLRAYFHNIVRAVAQIPGVDHVALTSNIPLRFSSRWMPFRVGGSAKNDLARRPACLFNVVSPTYFQTIQLRLLRGRTLTDRDNETAQSVTVINQALAAKYFPNADPIGKALLIEDVTANGSKEMGSERAWTIVGIVPNEKTEDLPVLDEFPGAYVPLDQSPTADQALLVRTTVPPASLRESVKKSIQRINREQLVSDVMTLDDIKLEVIGPLRFVGFLLELFAGTALFLSMLGIYGVISNGVLQRTHEIGIRSALGAPAGRILWLILRQGMILTAFGLLLGLIGSYLVGRSMAFMVFGVGVHDPMTIAATAVILGVIALIASYLPARRAIGINPIIALRAD